jgi:hypothetical protein
MMKKIDLANLRKPMTLRRTFGGAVDDYEVRIGDVILGRIMLRNKSFGQSLWLWSVTGPYIPPTLQPSHGEAESFEIAKVDFKSKFTKWLDWAGKEGGNLWNGDGPGT